MNIEKRRAAAVAFVASMAGGGTDRASLASGFDCWNNAMGGLISGDTYLEGIDRVAAILPDMVMTIEDTVAEANKVCVRSSSRATLPDGTIYRNHYHFQFDFDGDLIARVHAFLNTKTAAEVLMPLVWGDRRDFG